MVASRLLLVLFFSFCFKFGLTAYKRVCYYTNWSQYRVGDGKFLPSDIDPHLCTHLIYAFGKLVGNTVDKLEYNDFQLYGQIQELKQQNPSLKILLALGGWTAGSVAYSQMAITQESRSQFVQSSIEFLRKWNFDGLDMDWEYPANRGGAPEDKVNFGLLIKELREAFETEAQTGSDRLLLTAAVAAGKYTIDTAYDVPVLARYMDFINIMSYDLHGSWESTTGHNSPLFPKSNEYWDNRNLNIEFVANYWHSLGAPKDKLIIGLATYGRTFTLSGSQTDIGAPARGPGTQGQYTKEAGFMAYYEICALQDSGKGQTMYDSEQMVPYYTDGSLWVGFDDEISIATKVAWLVSEGYGGAMIWALSLDDFKQNCAKSTRKFPLMNVIKDGLTSAENGEVLTTPVLPTGIYSVAPPSSTTTGTTVPGGNGFSCVGKNDGLHPDVNDCSRFYQCEGGRYFHMNCQSGLLYNADKKYCDYPSNVVCSSDQSSTMFSSVTSSTEEYTSTENPPSTSVTNNAGSSTSATKTPVSTSTVQMSSATSSSSSTRVTTTIGQTISPREFCQSKPVGFYADTNDCSSYFWCYNGGATFSVCPAGLVWNHIDNICDWPRNVDCSRSGDSVTTTTNSIASTTPVSSSTATTTIQQASTSTSTTGSTPIIGSTSAATSLSTPRAPETTTDTYQIPSTFCVNKASGNHPHPGDCSKYITCIGMSQYIRSCPSVLRWNHDKGNCDWDYNVVCNV